MTCLLTADNLSIIRGNRLIFRRLNLTLNAGEALHLLGENGSGKTTLLQILANILPPNHGNIHREQPLIFLGHKAGVKSLLTARENLSFAAKLYHYMPSDKIANAVENALEHMGIANLANRQVRHLSAGQQRRVQLARLWLSTPAIWLLDEPLTALDVTTVAHLSQHCEAHLQQGGGIIFTSHQPFLTHYAHATPLSTLQQTNSTQSP